MTRTNPWFIAPLVALAAFMEVLDISIANVSLQHIAGNLGASPEESTWILTAYLITNAIALPVSGWMSEYFGRTRFFNACILGFTVASLACGTATSLEALILFRTIQGLTGGALQPVSQAILADVFPPSKHGMAFAIYGIAVVAAPAIGPTLGGWITDTYSWHWIFLINVPVGLVLLMLLKRYLPADDAPEAHTRKPVDYIGFGLIATGLGALQWVLDRGQTEDWFNSDVIVGMTLLCIVATGYYIARALDQEAPIIDLSLFRYRNYALANLVMFILGAVLMGSTAMLPLFMQMLLGYTALDAGLVLSPGGLAIMVMMPVVGRLSSKLDLRALITAGLLCSAAALWTLGNLTLSISHEQLVWLRVWQAAGLAFLFIPTTTIGFSGLPPGATNQASAMMAFMRNLGGAVGIAVLVTFLTRITDMDRVIFVAHSDPASPRWQLYYQHLLELTGSPERALRLADLRWTAQGQLDAFSTGFRGLALLFLALIPAIWRVRRLPPAAQGPAGAH
ncbi:DHA2 family efflux MFS transporter permease subunit [Hahella sp. SMD15-11]|uniref:DHA2 family efflux MFS transporter permease subunit n=1 Tax=Thermohahella caldifontis TaxID=3142973 RepID=A0AB39UX12_9GAMM